MMLRASHVNLFFLSVLLLSASLIPGCSSSSNTSSAPASLSYQGSPFTFIMGVQIESKKPDINGYADSYTISPSLPDGLSLNCSTGTISGTPSEAAMNAEYTVTATNQAGCATAKIFISVIASWTRLLGKESKEIYGNSVAAQDGYIYTAGYTSGDIDGQIVTGMYDLSLSKYDGSGNRLWTKLFGTEIFTFGKGVTTLPDGDVCVTGFTAPGPETSKAVVLEYSPNGSLEWAELLGEEGQGVFGTAVASDSDGCVYVAGDTDSDMGGQAVSGINDMFLVKYGPDSNLEWVRLLGTAASITVSTCVAVDSNGNVYVSGRTNGNLDGQEALGGFNMFITKYSTSGVRLWTRLLGVEGADTFGASIAQSGSDIYVTGNTTGKLDGQTLTGTHDLFVAKYDSSGNRVWTRLSGAAGDTSTFGLGIAAGQPGYVYLTGITDGNLNGETLYGNHDAFLIKYNSAGQRLQTDMLGAEGSYTTGNGIAADIDGNIYFTGHTDADLGGQIKTGEIDMFLIRALP